MIPSGPVVVGVTASKENAAAIGSRSRVGPPGCNPSRVVRFIGPTEAAASLPKPAPAVATGSSSLHVTAVARLSRVVSSPAHNSIVKVPEVRLPVSDDQEVLDTLWLP